MSTDDTDLGLTHKDRLRMGQWAAEHNGDRNANVHGAVPPAGALERTREAVAAFRAEGRTYIKTKHVAERAGIRGSAAGKALKMLAEAGDIEPWGAGRQGGRTYRIDL